MRIRRRELEEVARIERIVPEELEDAGVNLVRARTGDEIDDRAGHVAVLDADGRVVHLEFLDAAERRLVDERSERLIVGADAVDQERDGLLAIAGGVEGQRADAANRPGREAALRRRDRTGHEQGEIGEVTPVQRNLFERWARDHVPDCSRYAIDQRDFRMDDDRLGLLTDDQHEVTDDGAADVGVERLDDLGAKSGCRRRDGVPAGRNSRDAVVTLGIRKDGQGKAGRVVAQADRSSQDDGAGFVNDTALEHRRGLRLCRETGAQHDEQDEERDGASGGLVTGKCTHIQSAAPHGGMRVDGVWAWIPAKINRNTYGVSSIAKRRCNVFQCLPSHAGHAGPAQRSRT